MIKSPAADKRDKRLWKGRFLDDTAPLVTRFSTSVAVDSRLYHYDIQGSLAHAKMLRQCNVLDAAEYRLIETGLNEIRNEIEAGRFQWQEQLEDVHMNIEAALTERIGVAGKKLHTGRSRNDQVATDLRLFVRDQCDELCLQLRTLQEKLIEMAEQDAQTVMPGFTHLQIAQPVSLGHHFLAWQEMLQRDRLRVIDCRCRVNISPLGAAALAGTPHPIDPVISAELLGFEKPFENSLDAVSDRDFAIEFCFCCTLLMTHLSRMAEELILWNSPQIGFIELPDRLSTGSSIMPQKKNPDIAELIRGRSARVQGHLVALITMMKGQPLAYNRDCQEDKTPVFDSADTACEAVMALIELLPALTFDRQRLRDAAEQGYATATDLADYLVARGIPFRDAHEITGNIVSHAIDQGQKLSELSLTTLCSYCSNIGEDIYQSLSPEGSVMARNHRGATAPQQVLQAALRARQTLAD